MPFGVEALTGLAHAPNALALEDRLHLLEHVTQAEGERVLRIDPIRAQGTFDAVDRLEPLAGLYLGALEHAPLDLTCGALAVVVQVGERSLVAILEVGVALLEVLCRGRGRRLLVLSLW